MVMTDQRMPFMTGVELLSTIKGSYPDAIRLLFTGYADIHAVIDAINQGNVFKYTVKPVAKEFVHLHGGTIRIESRKDERTRVTVALPID